MQTGVMLPPWTKPTDPPSRPAGVPDVGPSRPYAEKRMPDGGDWYTLGRVWGWCRGAWRECSVAGAWRDADGWWLYLEWREGGGYSDIVHEAAVVGWDSEAGVVVMPG